MQVGVDSGVDDADDDGGGASAVGAVSVTAVRPPLLVGQEEIEKNSGKRDKTSSMVT